MFFFVLTAAISSCPGQLLIAVLKTKKNISHDGELMKKRVMKITFCPNLPQTHRVGAVGQHVHMCFDGDPNPKQCIGRGQWDVFGRLWGQSGLGLAF